MLVTMKQNQEIPDFTNTCCALKSTYSNITAPKLAYILKYGHARYIEFCWHKSQDEVVYLLVLTLHLTTVALKLVLCDDKLVTIFMQQ